MSERGLEILGGVFGMLCLFVLVADAESEMNLEIPLMACLVGILGCTFLRIMVRNRRISQETDRKLEKLEEMDRQHGIEEESTKHV